MHCCPPRTCFHSAGNQSPRLWGFPALQSCFRQLCKSWRAKRDKDRRGMLRQQVEICFVHPNSINIIPLTQPPKCKKLCCSEKTTNDDQIKIRYSGLKEGGKREFVEATHFNLTYTRLVPQAHITGTWLCSELANHIQTHIKRWLYICQKD